MSSAASAPTMSVNRVPGADEIFIGSIASLRLKSTLERAKIKHVLSVMRLWDEDVLFEPYNHMVVAVDDQVDADLIQHFSRANRFIQQALDAGEAIFVHCAMGKSRSSTVIIAFLMQKYHLTPEEALARLRECRPMCGPNEGFMEQLQLYASMRYTATIDDHPLYQRWLYQCEVDRSFIGNEAPHTLFFADALESTGQAPSQNLELRCRKCRRKLATSQYFAEHSPAAIAQDDEPIEPGPEESSESCAHYFLEPLSWMRDELEQGKLSGRLLCPTCTANVGKYSWQGLRCTCGQWTVPGITIAKSKVDEKRIQTQQAYADLINIRVPPAPNPA